METSDIFAFGYSMDHPRLLEAIDFQNAIGSVLGKVLQMDGMRFRSQSQCGDLMHELQAHGIEGVISRSMGTSSTMTGLRAGRAILHFSCGSWTLRWRQAWTSAAAFPCWPTTSRSLIGWWSCWRAGVPENRGCLSRTRRAAASACRTSALPCSTGSSAERSRSGFPAQTKRRRHAAP